MHSKGLGWIVWAWSGSIQISISFNIFPAGVQAQSIPQQKGLLTVVVTPPMLNDAFFRVQNLAAQHTVKSFTGGKDPVASGAFCRRHGAAVDPLPSLAVG